MGAGCVAEVDMFMAYRRELPADQSASILRHIAGCPLCHDLWKRVERDAHIAVGIQCAMRGAGHWATITISRAPARA